MERGRWAVSALFVANGAMFSTVLPRLPEIKADLDLSDGQLGLALLGAGVGGLAGSSATGWLLPRLGARRLAVGSAVGLAAVLPLVGLAPAPVLLFAVLAVIGAGDAFMDVGMNVSGLEVQRRLRRPVLNGMHATWSLGAGLGAGAGAGAAALDVPLPLHLLLVGTAFAALALAAARDVPDHPGTGEGEHVGGRRLSGPLLLLCGLAVLAALLEDAPGSWSAVWLAEHTGAAAGAAGLGYVAFQAGMVGGRLVADRVVHRYGAARVVRLGGAASAAALAVALTTGSTAVGVVAFGVVGLGAAPLFPAMFGAAASLPGQGVAAVNAASRVGFLASPPVVGLVADGVGLPLALGLLVVPAAVGIALLATALVPRRP